MHYSRVPFAAAVTMILFSLFFISLPGCKTTEEHVTQAVVEPTPIPEPEAVSEPDPLNIDWAGTAWILPDPPEQTAKEFPGYRGFFLGRDGRLLLINQDNAAGDLWNVDGNRISLSLLNGAPQLNFEGTFLVFSVDPVDPGEKNLQSIRLVPETAPSADGITLNRVKVNIDIVENHWIPKRLTGDKKVMWPMNREIHLMLLPDVSGMGVLGYGGENRFHGGIHLGEESFILQPLAMTRRIGPASEFENLYTLRLSETNRFVQVGDDLFLYSDTYPTAAFRVRLFD